MTEQDGLLRSSELLWGLLGSWRRVPGFVRTALSMGFARPEDERSLSSVLARTAARHPTRPAIKYDDVVVTYGELDRRVDRMANALRAAGLEHGEVACVLMENRPELLVVVAAATRLGASAALINTNLRQGALRHALRCAPARVFVVGDELRSSFDAVADELPETGRPGARLWVSDTLPAVVPAGWVDLLAQASRSPPGRPYVSRAARMGDPAFYVFTSGTTGLPKASIMSHRRWIGAGLMFGEACLALRPGDTIYAPLPLYHNQAITLCWSAAVRCGAAIAIRRGFSATAFWDDCRRFDATAIAYIGEITRYLVNQPRQPGDRRHGVRCAVGVGMRPALWGEFKRRFGIEEIFEYYSASELNAGFFNLLNLDRTVGFCPTPWALVAFDTDTGAPVRGADGRMIRLRRGDTGLLVTRVTNRAAFEGYTDPEATRAKLLHDVFESGDTWVHTGDLMRNIGFGHLQFVDRVGDTFRWKSENVATTEVEAVVAAEPSVSEAAVYGVRVPHTSGRAGMAAVVPCEALDRDALLRRLRSELPDYAVPRFLRVTQQLQTTGTFKHQKGALRRDGFDPGRVADPLFVWLPDTDCWTPLTVDVFGRIQRSEVQL